MRNCRNCAHSHINRDHYTCSCSEPPQNFYKAVENCPKYIMCKREKEKDKNGINKETS